MRLTLRTLLAYMDDILEPQDHEELEKRIETSEFAHDLIHRTRDTMRRLRLTAPPVKGDGIGLDPNTVAEYLDNTLVADQVADFERVCLESDAHLAEVASCHHVLTMVLGEPAEIDPEVRRRMYALPSQAAGEKMLRIEPAHMVPLSEPTVQTSTVVVSPEGAVAPVRRVEVPDYLRAAEPSLLKRLLPAVAAVVALSTVSYFAFRPNGWLRDGTQLAQSESPTNAARHPSIPAERTEPGPSDQTPSPAPTSPGTETDVETEIAPLDEPETPAAIEEDAVGSATVDETEATIEPPLAPEPMEVPPQSAPTLPPAGDDVATPSPDVEVPPLPPPVPTPSASDERPADSSAELPAGTETPTTTPGEVPGDPSAEPPVESDRVAATETGPAEPAVLGTFASVRQVLLRLEPDGTWQRVPPRAAVQAESELLALPTYRPMIALATGLNAELLGGTLLELESADPASVDPADVPQITLVYGRLLLINTRMSALNVPLRIGAITATVELEPNATLAVDAQRLFLPGNDPAKTPSPISAILYAPAGGVVWRSPDATLEVPDPGMWQLAGDSVGSVQAYQETGWINGEPLSYWEQMSSPAIERMLNTGEPIETQLLGLYRSTRRKEEKALITECSMHVGQFVPFVKSLNDSDQFPEWDRQIDALREAISRSPELAQSVLETMIVERGADKAPDLYRLLCGFSPDQVGSTPEEIQTGAVRQLIDWLESDQLDYRVLAFRNLKELTGKQLSYNPAGNADSRARTVRVWRVRLKDNELIPTP